MGGKKERKKTASNTELLPRARPYIEQVLALLVVEDGLIAKDRVPEAAFDPLYKVEELGQLVVRRADLAVELATELAGARNHRGEAPDGVLLLLERLGDDLEELVLLDRVEATLDIDADKEQRVGPRPPGVHHLGRRAPYSDRKDLEPSKGGRTIAERPSANGQKDERRMHACGIAHGVGDRPFMDLNAMPTAVP